MNKILKQFDLSDDQLQKLNEYMEMVLEANKYFNLTSITDKDLFVEKHIYDSLLILKYIE
jgi:16S rRNA (guanine527-N7)-methyltransferase